LRWWKDICALEDCMVSKNWLREAIERIIDDGENTMFCREQWLGNNSFDVMFIRLFSSSLLLKKDV
jgi:hypothetical protein